MQLASILKMDGGKLGKWKNRKKKKRKKESEWKGGFERGISDCVARQPAARESYDLQDHYGLAPARIYGQDEPFVRRWLYTVIHPSRYTSGFFYLFLKLFGEAWSVLIIVAGLWFVADCSIVAIINCMLLYSHGVTFNSLCFSSDVGYTQGMPRNSVLCLLTCTGGVRSCFLADCFLTYLLC